MNEKRTTAGIIFLTLFVDLVGFSIIFPLLPELLDHYFTLEGADSFLGRLKEWLGEWTPASDPAEQEILIQTLFGGCLGALYSLLQFLFSPFWGRLSDRHGRRPVLLVSLVGTVIAYGLWIFSGSFALLVVSRIIGGAASGNISTASAAMADITDRSNRAKGMGLLGMAFGLGFILGPAIGGTLAAYVDLAAIFPASTAYGINPFSSAALAAFLLAAANLFWVATRFRETLPPEKRHSGQSGRAIDPRALFTTRFGPDVFRTTLAYFVFLVAFSGMEFTLTFLVRDRFNWGTASIAVMFVYVGFIIALVQGGIVRRLAPQMGEKRVAVIGLVILAPGLALIGLAATSTLLYGALGIMAVGSALVIPTLTALTSLNTPADQQGHALGVFRSLGALARAIGPFLAALLYWRFGNQVPYIAAGIFLLLPLWILSRVRQPEKSVDDGAGDKNPPRD